MKFIALIVVVFLGCNNSSTMSSDQPNNHLYTINSSRDVNVSSPIKEDAITNFEDRVSSGETLVEFNAPWCSACQQQKPMVAMLMDRNPRLKLIEVNVDDNAILAQRYQIAFVPTFKFFRNGFLVGTTGYSTADELQCLIQMGNL